MPSSACSRRVAAVTAAGPAACRFSGSTKCRTRAPDLRCRMLMTPRLSPVIIKESSTCNAVTTTFTSVVGSAGSCSCSRCIRAWLIVMMDTVSDERVCSVAVGSYRQISMPTLLTRTIVSLYARHERKVAVSSTGATCTTSRAAARRLAFLPSTRAINTSRADEQSYTCTAPDEPIMTRLCASPVAPPRTCPDMWDEAANMGKPSSPLPPSDLEALERPSSTGSTCAMWSSSTAGKTRSVEQSDERQASADMACEATPVKPS
mmetsp:Transcript_3051/g.10004  ORF Transcript_3051/g.10004 Transcript_3051/m.10004 type:complete len:262 (+) Transcript_3051:2202-2987(+)